VRVRRRRPQAGNRASVIHEGPDARSAWRLTPWYGLLVSVFLLRFFASSILRV